MGLSGSAPGERLPRTGTGALEFFARVSEPSERGTYGGRAAAVRCCSDDSEPLPVGYIAARRRCTAGRPWWVPADDAYAAMLTAMARGSVFSLHRTLYSQGLESFL